MHVDQVLKCLAYGVKKPKKATRWHVFELAANRSLCGNWSFPGELVEPLDPAVAEADHTDGCEQCFKRLKAALGLVKQQAK